ncbi:actin-like ATPase domain-containing protein [Gonapodya prolifera JEL478]|uniref:Actin-like ATPase domain-containing protein n=1 Tax=Gonapodya prolifera (strain JEL478) TaxID=1344416 RepID=A0A139AC83_GONPJ|nr:actin-like ATPase domain-containing protein [Gonapodya prolifera JEL478]|eukprot:KXS14377.1 actin-like ATPase domain-containing protein [Gonapodya prolifera JEL478]
MSFWPREENVIVLDFGSYSVKFGKAFEMELPQQIHSKVGRRRRFKGDDDQPPNENAMEEDGGQGDASADSGMEILVGEELTDALKVDGKEKRPIVTPIISRGRVKDWEALTVLLRHIIFDLLEVDPNRNDHPVIASVPVYWGIESMQRLTQILFEDCAVPGFFLVEQPLAAVYAMGFVSGVVVDIGHDVTSVCAVLDNEPQVQSLVTLPIGGAQVDAALLKLLQSDPPFCLMLGREPDLDIASRVKEVAALEVPIEGLKLAGTIKEVEIDGVKLPIPQIRHHATEALFPVSDESHFVSHPDLAGAIVRCLNSCEPDKRPSLAESVIICGGSSKFDGLRTRLDVLLKSYFPASETLGDYQPRELRYLRLPEYMPLFEKAPHALHFVGAALTGRAVYISPPQDRCWISKYEYSEMGPAVVTKKTTGMST